MSRVMRKPIFIISLIALIGAVCASAHFGSSRSRKSVGMAVEIDSVDFRADLTRVHCRVIGSPHTGHRIDGVTLTAGESGSAVYPASDIEGVDFSRYFQWEDDGSIAVEIDFAPVPTGRQSQVGMSLTTVYGNVTVPAVKLRDGKPVSR